jgi:hypothetical protein
MPLLINVGLNRKASKDFQSVGVSLNLTAELDQGLLADPPRLQSEIERIYGQAEQALERQITAMGPESTQATASVRPQSRQANAGNGRSAAGVGAAPVEAALQPSANAGNGVHAGAIRPATESQLKALGVICKRNGLDLNGEAHDEFGVAANDLDVRQASQLIDALKERLGLPEVAPAGRRWRS